MEASKDNLYDYQKMTVEELERMGIEKKDRQAIYILGRKLIEGCWITNNKINEKMGLTWLKDNAKAGHRKSEEYLAYYDMKFNPHFNIKKIIQTLESAAVPSTGEPSAQAALTLGELFYLQSRKQPDSITTSLKYYEMAAKMGCGYAEYWVGYINATTTKKLDLCHANFLSSYKKGFINAAYQLFLLYSKATEYLNVEKAYFYLNACCEFGLPCFDELNLYFQEHLTELKPLNESWKAWPDTELQNIHSGEMEKMSKNFFDSVQTDKLYKRPSVVFIENKGNWFLSKQAKNFVKIALTYPMNEFLIMLKEELYPVFSSVGLFILENWLARTKAKSKDTKIKRRAIELGIELVQIYLAEGLDGLKEKLKRFKKNIYKPSERLMYNYTDFIHPSYFHEQAEAKPEIVCACCKKPQGTNSFAFCSACKKVYYCSKECQIKDWKENHKTQCKLLREPSK